MAIVAFLAMLAALAVGVVHLVGLLAGTRSPWRFALAGVFLVPSYLVATTQVYPDLMTGMIIAIVVLLVALFEAKRGCTTAQVVTGGLLLALIPWLAQKNIPLTCLLVVVLVVASRRTLMAGAQLAWLAVPALVSLSGVVLFNLWAYGHPLGSKNPVTTSGIETWTRSAALVFDRRSGILIQMPILVLGVAALWVWRRRIPLAAIAAVVLTAAIVYGNGTEPGSQTGGSFNGRYEWPLVPLALAFCALYVIDLWRVRRCDRTPDRRHRGGAVGLRGGAHHPRRAPLLQPDTLGPDLLPGLVGGPRPLAGPRLSPRRADLQPPDPDPGRRQRDPGLPPRYHPVGQRPRPLGVGLRRSC